MGWTPKDVIAGIVLVGCMVMIGLGIDSWVKYTLLTVAVGYFGIDIIPAIKLTKRSKDPPAV